MSRLEIAASKADARAADAARKLGAPQVLAEIERRYSKDEGWITMAELTDPGTMRRIDALALHTYQSRGLEMVGFEIKVSRSDWLGELKDPSKADVFARFCHRWWIVTPEGVVEPEELPAAWGHVVVAPGAARPWRVRKKAPRLEPRELTRLFFMVCLRGLERRFERPITEAIQAAREKAYQEGQAQCAARHVDRSSDGDDLAKRHSKLVEKTRAFGEATGLFLDRPYDDARDLGVAVRATQRLAESNGWVERAIESDIKRLTEAMATIKETRANVRRVLGIPDAEASE